MIWQTVKLGELAEVKTGKLDANAADENGLYPFFTCAVEPLSINTSAFDCKAILVAGNGDLNVKYYEGKFNAYQRTYVIQSLNEKILLPRYLYLFLNEYVNELRALAIGGVIKYIKLANLTDALIPLPPLAEQERIASILDKAEEVKRKRELAIEKLDALAQSVFIEMFGDSVANNKNWESKSLGEIADFYAGNSLPKELVYKNQIDGYFLMKVSDMNSLGNEREIKSCKSWSDIAGAKSATCPIGSIVIPKRGGAIGTNKKRITIKPTVLDPNLMAIKPKEGVVLTEYLFQWFLNFDLLSITNGSSVPQLNKKDLDPLRIQIPEIKAQEKFRDFIELHLAHKARNINLLKREAMLFDSLKHQAFSGQL